MGGERATASVLILGAAAICALTLDQATKRAVRVWLPRGGGVRVASGVWLKHVVNARGGLVPLGKLPALGISLLVVAELAILVLLLSPLSLLCSTGLGLLVGGALSNLAERLARGAIVDFIAVGRWPTFNVADAAMSVGLVLAVSGAS